MLRGVRTAVVLAASSALLSGCAALPLIVPGAGSATATGPQTVVQACAVLDRDQDLAATIQPLQDVLGGKTMPNPKTYARAVDGFATALDGAAEKITNTQVRSQAKKTAKATKKLAALFTSGTAAKARKPSFVKSVQKAARTAATELGRLETLCEWS